MLFSNMSTGLNEDGATVSKSVFSTPNASGESRSICNIHTNTHKPFTDASLLKKKWTASNNALPAVYQSWAGLRRQSVVTASSTYLHSPYDTAAGPG